MEPPRWPRGSRTLFYAAVFALTAAGVYRWGMAAARPAMPSTPHTATASVVLGDGLSESADLDRIRQQIIAPANVGRAAEQAGLAWPQDADPQALEITGDTASKPGELAIAISATGPFGEHPDQLVNALAESFAADCLAEWKQRVYETYAAARQEASEAEREFLDAKADLEAFYQEQVAARSASMADDTGGDERQDGQDPTSQPPVAQADAPAVSSTVENPEWTELNGRLTALRQRLSELSATRTALHPEVRDTELQIAQLQGRLAAISHEIPGRTPGQTAEPDEMAAVRPSSTPQQAAPRRSETAERFEQLKEAASRAADAYLAAFQGEREAWRAQQQSPQIGLRRAEPIPPPATAGLPPWTALLGAMAGGLAMAMGLGMVSAGAAIQPPLGTVEQVRQVLSVPVVGTVPQTHPSNRIARRQRAARWRRIVAGLALIAGCAGVLLWAWGG